LNVFFPLTFSAIIIFMSKQDTLIPKKKRGPAPTGQGKPVMVRLQPSSLEALDAWRKKEPDTPGRPEAIRRLMETALGRAR
jgi:hypothetical protein